MFKIYGNDIIAKTGIKVVVPPEQNTEIFDNHILATDTAIIVEAKELSDLHRLTKDLMQIRELDSIEELNTLRSELSQKLKSENPSKFQIKKLITNLSDLSKKFTNIASATTIIAGLTKIVEKF